MSTWHTQEEVDALVRERVSEQLRRDIGSYDEIGRASCRERV